MLMMATHYHMLTYEFEDHPDVCMKHMRAHTDPDAEDDDAKVTFMYEMIEGVCLKSYGMIVANMAGIDEAIITRAYKKSTEFERDSWVGKQASLRKLKTILNTINTCTKDNACEAYKKVSKFTA
mmetsp:Transcript_15450/g.17194  ORF Transcript_15450/g.17194 Transcript_15450/m.17194 type:complete len:124 (+) Transcript_15450:190-561(+)